jgi:2-keto-3-deoxy-L-rhamnonate aldolase RhmA
MRENRLKQVQAQGGIPIGHMVWEFATRGIARLVDSADPDFVIFDMEHSSVDLERIADLMGWARACRFAPFVRIPQGLYHFAARVMDAGALGIMQPNVESAAQAKALVDAVKYAPLGRRGVGLGTAHTDYRTVDPAAYFASANQNSTIICQIESDAGVENAQAIATTAGVDILWVGHFDLTQSMGIPGQFDSQRFEDAMRHVAETAKRHGKAAGVQPGSREQAQQWMQWGYNVISYGADTAVYRNALADGIKSLRSLSAKA